jgi:iron complex transport system substrate-binding protein
MNRLTRTLLALLFAVAVTACAAAPAAEPIAAPAAEPTAAPAAEPITDALGREVDVPADVIRVVSLAPSITEILFAVGAGSQVVGNTEYCDYPIEAEDLTKIGGFSADTISIESIVALEPDLVIGGSLAQASVAEALTAVDIPTLVFDPQTFDDVYNNITQIGVVTGHAAEAEAVVTAMRERVAAVEAIVAEIPDDQRPTVFYELFDEPLMTAGSNTFIGQMIDLVGAESIFADASEDYPQVSTEVIIERDPQVIVGPDSHGDKLTIDQLAERPGWAEISAVRDGRIYLLDGDMVSRPGPRLADVLEELAQVLYPDQFQ